MKKVFTIGLMMLYAIAFSGDRKEVKKQANADLIGTWQFITCYNPEAAICTSRISSLEFYSDQTCVITDRNIDEDRIISQSVYSRKWLIFKNNIIVVDGLGKQESSYTSKTSAKDLMKGQKVIHKMLPLTTGNQQENGERLAYSFE